VAARAAETSARAPGVGNRKVFLSTNASAGADGGGEASPNHARRQPGAGHGGASEGGIVRSRAWGHRSARGAYTVERKSDP
jgi:hypothetical protein